MKKVMHNTIHRSRYGHRLAATALSRNSNLNPDYHSIGGLPCRQDGVALIVSLVILMILTILGMASMGTSSMELKMSGNAQTTTQALEAAESGLAQMFNALTSLDPNQPQTSQTYTYGSGATTMKAVVSIKSIDSSGKNVAGSGMGLDFQTNYFDQASVGTTATALGGRSTVHQGLNQMSSASQY